MSSEKNSQLVLEADAFLAGKKLKAGSVVFEGSPAGGLTITAVDKAMKQGLVKVKLPVEQPKTPAQKSKEAPAAAKGS